MEIEIMKIISKDTATPSQYDIESLGIVIHSVLDPMTEEQVLREKVTGFRTDPQSAYLEIA